MCCAVERAGRCKGIGFKGGRESVVLPGMCGTEVQGQANVLHCALCAAFHAMKAMSELVCA